MIQVEATTVMVTNDRGVALKFTEGDNDDILVDAPPGAFIPYEDLLELLTALGNYYNTGFFNEDGY